MNSLHRIEAALADERFETARRLCLSALAESGAPVIPLRFLLHQAYRRLGDFAACRQVLEQTVPENDAQQDTVNRLFAEDYAALASGHGYRTSAEAAAGFTYDEYQAKYRDLAASFRSRCKAPPAAPPPTSTPAPPPIPAPAAGRLAGTLTFPDGRPVAQATVTLGLHMDIELADPTAYLAPHMHYDPKLGPLSTLTTRTDERGAYRFDEVPADRHAFLAVTLDPQAFDIATRFLAHDLEVAAGKTTRLDRVVDDWQSAPARVVVSPFSGAIRLGGLHYRRVHEETLKNPFDYDFPRQAVCFPVPDAAPADPRRWRLLSSADPGVPVPFQLAGRSLTFFTDLPARTDRVVALYVTDAEGQEPFPPLPALTLAPEASGHTALIDTGRATFRLPCGTAPDAQPPLLAVRGEDGVWRGTGRWRLPAGVEAVRQSTQVLESGPLVLVVEVSYVLTGGHRYVLQFTAHRGEAYLLAREVSPDLPDAAFEFSLREFHGGRGFLHWTPEHGNEHWSTLSAADREIARLQESVPWWIPPCGFGYAMTADGLQQRDYIGVFTLRRGEWIDRAFARLAQGPGDVPPERRELDWPFPEMVGSTLSMITAHTDAAGDAFFRFGLFDGERQWGLVVSTLDRNDGPWKEISAVQHKNSSPRLQNFKDWHLDTPDTVARPHVVARRDELRALRRKTTAPHFAQAWSRICSGTSRGPAAGLRFAVGNDPAVAWRKKCELVGVARIRARMTLLGRDFADMYSPVGIRPITTWAEEYDLIAASGAFTPDEERLVRQFLLLMGCLCMDPDLMNWRYGSRNANFEADRVDVIGTLGVVFSGNPDAERFKQHAIALMEQSLNVYGTPGSGRWYENPACYYLQATKCRANLIFHLTQQGMIHPTQWPRWKEVLQWGIWLLTPPFPHDGGIMRDGTPDYAGTEKVRRISPIGDHAHLGPWVPEHYALMSKLYRGHDDAFADRLLWAYRVGGSDGGYHGNMPLFFAGLEEADLAPPSDVSLTSRRLEGFGAAFRGHFGKPDEFFLLLKQGPGGYRYHRTEGSLLMFADGKPLVYDGGEGGETWRHTTLSFGNAHLPLTAGHVERFRSFEALDFCQGVHSNIVRPGEPVYLCDNCHHSLVEVALRRFREPHPADSRSVLWVKDEYVVLHDELNLPQDADSHWHLQAVADAETGNARDGWIFQGRFGTDLQVLLPDQEFVSASVEPLPILEYHVQPETCFAMRHLHLTGRDPRFYLAILRPLASGRRPVEARAMEAGLGTRVTGDGIDDDLFLSRTSRQIRRGGLRFDGRYAAILRRPEVLHLTLLDGHTLETDGHSIESTGPAVHMEIRGPRTTVRAEGMGEVTVVSHGHRETLSLTAPDRREERTWSRG